MGQKSWNFGTTYWYFDAGMETFLSKLFKKKIDYYDGALMTDCLYIIS